MNRFRVLSWISRVLLLAFIVFIFRTSPPIAIFHLLMLGTSFLFLLSPKKIMIRFEFFFILLFILNAIGIISLYNKFSFYDGLIHFFAGVIFAYFLYNLFSKKAKLYTAIIALAGAVFLGIAWEFFEFFWDIFITPRFNTPPAQESFFDTFSDIIYDFAGSLVSVFYLSVKKKNEIHKKRS